jgi:hypothetical protein
MMPTTALSPPYLDGIVAEQEIQLSVPRHRH